MLKNIEKLHESIFKEKHVKKKYFEKNKKHKTAIENVKLASDIFEQEYVEALRERNLDVERSRNYTCRFC